MKLINLIRKHLGYEGRLIASSKSLYHKNNPNSLVYFNACIFNSKGKQIWWGDIDLTKDEEKLFKIREESKEDFYVTPEHPFRSDFYSVTKESLESDPNVKKFW